MSISLVDQRSQTVTLDEVTRPNVQTMRRMVDVHGYEDALKVVTRLVMEADVALGGDGDPSRCVPVAANAMIGNGHRGLGFLVVSIREGMKGKVYGNKINVSLMNEWTAAQEGRIMSAAEDAHARTKFVDNGGRDTLDKMQHESGADQRKIARLTAYNEMLRAKLSNEGQ